MSGTALRPEDLHKISEEVEVAKVREALARRRKEEEEKHHLRDAFMAEELPPNAMELLNTMVRRAAEQNRSEILVMTFPAEWCNDKGRRINNGDTDWPQSLQGRAMRAYDFYERHLKELGYKIRVQILNYPDGMPGEIGFFLRW
jgi:hypothetical protein